MTLANPTSYLEVIASVTTFDKKNYQLGDYFLVVRNDTGGTGTGTDIEATFQFLGEEVIPLRNRDIAATELASTIYMTYVDDYFINELFVLDLYYNSDTNYPGYDVYEFKFGNLAKTIRVIPTPPSEYLAVTYPTNTATHASDTSIDYDFLNVAANTNFTRIFED